MPLQPCADLILDVSPFDTYYLFTVYLQYFIFLNLLNPVVWFHCLKSGLGCLVIHLTHHLGRIRFLSNSWSNILVIPQGKGRKNQYSDIYFSVWIVSDLCRNHMTWHMLTRIGFPAIFWDYIGYFGFKAWKNVPPSRDILPFIADAYLIFLLSLEEGWEVDLECFIHAGFCRKQKDCIAAQGTVNKHI